LSLPPAINTVGLVDRIGAIIERRGLTQSAAAELLEIDQPKVSALTRGRLSGFSLDRLVCVSSCSGATSRSS